MRTISAAIPIHGSTETAKPSVHDHDVSLSHDRSRFMFQRWWDALDEIEQTLTARCDMSALLKRVSKASSTSALFFSCFARLIEVFLACKHHALRSLGVSIRHRPDTCFDHRAVLPPSTRYDAPVMNDAL